MKNKLLLMIVTILLAVSVVGCSTSNVEEVYTLLYETIESSLAEESSSENVTEEFELPEEAFESESIAETQEAEVVDLTFAELSERRFEFSSGAGGWSEEFTIEKDGYFTGKYHDSDMGDKGEGYAGGTFYSCSYSGHFTDLIKINDYTYEMKLADISYSVPVDTVEICDNVRYIYTDSYCLGGTDTFTIYLPGTPFDELSEDVRIWLYSNNQSETELTMITMVDKDNGYGIYSYERFSPLEDARMTFHTYQDSYNYYSEKLSEAATTMEMVECSGTMYQLSDECLNYIWNLIRYNVEEDKYSAILEEQRQWIVEKEERAKEAMAEYEGGSFAAVSYNDTLATLTMKRCEELIEYLK